jgi:hypothetical protein
MKVRHTVKAGEVSETTEIEFTELTEEVKKVLIYLGIKEEPIAEQEAEDNKPKKDLGDFKLLNEN